MNTSHLPKSSIELVKEVYLFPNVIQKEKVELMTRFFLLPMDAIEIQWEWLLLQVRILTQEKINS